MTPHGSTLVRSVVLGTVGLLLTVSLASADIYTFYKTGVCPNLGTKTPLAAIQGRAAAVVTFSGSPTSPTPTAGAGGLFCDVVPPGQKITGVTSGPKNLAVANADMVALTGDEPGGSVTVGGGYFCVICQYSDNVTSMPTLSVLGTVLLMTGLLTAAAYRIGRRQRRESAA